jgi:Tfp pilus assembly protein PilF
MTVTAREYIDYGLFLAQTGKIEDAISIFCQAIEKDPTQAEAYNNLGVLFREKRELRSAEACFRKAIDLRPEDAIHYNNLALVFLDTQRLAEAELCLQEALKFDADLPELYNSLALVYEEEHEVEKAQLAYGRAIEIHPKYTAALYNLGILLKSIKQSERAEYWLKQAIKSQPDYGPAEFALATLYLREGRYADGWKLYDASRLLKVKNRAGSIPIWQGEALAGGKLLLFYDQGFGDTIQFVRYVDMAAALGAKIVLWVQAPLRALLETSYPELDIYAGAARPAEQFDYACSLMSLPKVFHTTMSTIPRGIPYIQATPACMEKWQNRLAGVNPLKKKKIGVVWAGNPKHNDDQNRSIAFSLFHSLFSGKDVLWVSLQAGQRALDLTGASARVIDYSAEFLDFSQTAGLIANLDLVITIDSAVAHLAGAMGKTTWLLLPFSPDWRWHMERRDSPWYSTMRLFRQTASGDWPEVLNRVKIALQDFILQEPGK